MVYVVSYNTRSRSAHRLARGLGGRTVAETGIKLNAPVINWGNGDCSEETALNRGVNVRIAANKKNAFRIMKEAGVRVPAFTTDKNGVTWDGATVVRHKLTGHSGEGIEVVEENSPLPDAPLYVQYIKKQHEYRVHVGRNKDGETEIIAVQRKGLRSDFDGKPDWRIRNHKFGFVFVRNGEDGNGITPSVDVLEQAKKAVVALGLDFGAVDVVYNNHSGRAFILEVNCAPGLEGTTVGDYIDFFKRRLGL